MTWNVGASRVIVTPPVGVELAGYGFGPSVGILDELEAQALWLQQGDETAVIVTVDMLMFGAEFVDRVRERAMAELGVPGDHVLLSASHSHSSPTAVPLRQWGRVDQAYSRVLESQLVGAMAVARRRATRARLGTGVGRVDNVSENRRRIEGLLDPSVPVLRFDDEAGDPIAILFNYGCHPVSLHSYRNLISPDYPGYARQVVRTVLGRDTVAMFTLGTAGDVNPAGYVAGKTTPQRARQIGAILGCEVARVALAPSHWSAPVLRVRQTILDFDFKFGLNTILT